MCDNGGLFKSIEDLNKYEKMWHNSVYQPAWEESIQKVS